ncbi:MAG: CheB methylesterase domain-containing protein [Verrucomicrobia bacterium]|nr:CheB methylesterase domain-containing protein [Verrucomicrobiota bacterium]
MTRLNRGEKLHFQRPAVDVMFNSIKESKARQVIAVLLTGMGKDGAEGMLKLRQSGATTIVQNRDTCVVYGMPREAELLGAVKFSLPLGEIAEKLVKLSASSGRSELEATSASLNLKSATT